MIFVDQTGRTDTPGSPELAANNANDADAFSVRSRGWGNSRQRSPPPKLQTACLSEADEGYNSDMFRAIAAVILLAVIPAGSLSAAQGPKWLELSSKNFLLYTDTSEAKGRRLLVDLENRMDGFAEAFGEITPAQFPIEVFLFNDERDFVQAAPTTGIERADKSAYVIRGPDRVFIVAKDKSPDDISNDAGHALGHVLFERQVMWRPFWLAEGASEYVRMIGRNPDGKRVSAEDAFSAADLLTIVSSAAYDDRVPGSVFRLQSYRLLRILFEDHPAALEELFQTLGTEAGATAKLGIDVEGVQNRLSQYAETLLKPPAQAFEITVAEADPARLAIHRGDLLLASGKTADAASWYNADSNEARSARAILNRFNRGLVEAFRILERVARELPEAGLVQFHLGAIETQVPKDIESQVAALERAVQLLPDFGPAHAELARVYALSGNAAKAMPLISRALELSPEIADRIYEIRSDVQTALGEYDEAFRVIEIADRLPHGDRSAAEKFGLRVGNVKRKIETARRDVEDRRLQEIRRDVAAIVEEREPPPAPTPPPPPIPDGRITYDIQARTPLEVIDAVLPDYPETLRKAGTAGRITLRADIGADGKVKAASIAESDIAALNAATLDAVKKWSFKAQRAVSIRVTINYLLQ